MKNKGFAVLIAILVIAGMLTTSIGIAFAEPYHILSGRDKVGTYGQDGKSARLGYINTSVFEGTTYDEYKTWLSAVDPTGINVILLQDGSGTLSFTTDAFAGALADGKILIGNNVGGGVAVAVTPSGLWDITNGGVATGILADGLIWIGNNAGGGDAVAVTMSGLTGITNAGVTAANANTIGTSALNVNTVSVTVASSGTSGTATVTSGSTILGHYGFANIHDTAYNGITNVSIASTTLTALINGTAGANAVVHKVVVLEP